MVQGYTLGQLRAFGQAIDRDRVRRERTLALLIRMANNADPDDFDAFLKD